MDGLLKFLVLCTTLIFVQCSMIESTVPLPAIDAWWGSEESKKTYDTSIREFEAKFDEEMIFDLRYRLKNHRPFTPPLEGAAFNYGVNTDILESWVTYWAESYNFTARQAYINQFPQFKTNIQGLDIHFIRIKPEVPSGVKVVPLLMLHGWPTSVVEFYKVIPMLTEVNVERGYALELIIPSLPGFGFSDATRLQGFGATEIAVVLRNLMHRLGHEKFYTHGGDWGTYICYTMACLFPDEVLGEHSNYGISLSPASWITLAAGGLGDTMQSLVIEPGLESRLYPFTSKLKQLMINTGYLHLQATKPYSLGVGMDDSPIGLLTYIFQFVSMAVRQENINKDDGGLLDYYTHDELIDNLMIYWMNRAFTSSCLIYAETLNMRNVENGWFSLSTPVPVVLVQAPDELLYMSTDMLKHIYINILNNTAIPEGGHFLASEKPELFTETVFSAVTLFRNWHEERENCKIEL